MTDEAILHPLISELHAELAARGWRPSDEVLDLAQVMVARGGPLGIRQIGPLSERLRASNGLTLAQAADLAKVAWHKAGGRALALARASGSRPARPQVPPARSDPLLAIRVQIKDRAAWERLSPAGVRAYLTAHGWQVDPGPARRSVEGLPLGEYWGNGRGSWVLVPRETAADRAHRLADLVRDLEEVEGRSQLLIYRDLLAAA
jgi:hypothetical protein